MVIVEKRLLRFFPELRHLRTLFKRLIVGPFERERVRILRQVFTWLEIVRF